MNTENVRNARPADADLRPGDEPRLSASRLALAARCPGSFSLTHDGHENPAAEKGTEIHSFLEGILVDGLAEPERVPGPEARAVCEGLDPNEVIDVCAARMGALHVEVSFAYDPRTREALVLEGGGHRDYSSAPAGAVCGTADVVALWTDPDGTGRVLVSDWKTGRAAVEAPHENRQLAFLALCAKKTLGRPEDRVAAQIAYVGADGAIHATGHEFAAGELSRAEDELGEIHAKVGASRTSARQGKESLITGAHCRFCPAFARCPAIAGAAQALLAEKDDELTPEKVPGIWATLQAVEAAAKTVRARLTDYAANSERPLPTEAGKRLKLVESRRDRIDSAKAMPLLRERYGGAADAAASVSKTGLKKLAGGDLERVMARLDETGAVETTYTESLREVAAETGTDGR